MREPHNTIRNVPRPGRQEPVCQTQKATTNEQQTTHQILGAGGGAAADGDETEPLPGDEHYPWLERRMQTAYERLVRFVVLCVVVLLLLLCVAACSSCELFCTFITMS